MAEETRIKTTVYATIKLVVEHPEDWDSDQVIEILDGADYAITLDDSESGGAKIVDTEWVDTSDSQNDNPVF